MAVAELMGVAQRYLAEWLPERRVDLARLADRPVRLDEAFCCAVAEHFEAQPGYAWSAALARRYAALRVESLRQYEAIVAAGLRVEPWTGPGQPYGSGKQLREGVLATGTLYVYLTRDGHGPPGEHATPHPLRGPSGVRCSGVELTDNDVLRVVHDVFGHVLLGYGFGPAGELGATYCQLALYSADAHPVLFSEQVSQICWFYYGPHLRTDTGHLPRRDEPGWVPPADRPYPEQKVFDCPQWLVDRFTASCEGESS